MVPAHTAERKVMCKQKRTKKNRSNASKIMQIEAVVERQWERKSDLSICSERKKLILVFPSTYKKKILLENKLNIFVCARVIEKTI